MVRRLDEACSDGEAPTAKVTAPPPVLISNIKRPKGGTRGFTSQRQDQRCEGGWMKKMVTICCPDKLITFTNCMYVTSRIISWHYRPSLITNRVPTLILYETAQRTDGKFSIGPLY